MAHRPTRLTRLIVRGALAILTDRSDPQVNPVGIQVAAQYEYCLGVTCFRRSDPRGRGNADSQLHLALCYGVKCSANGLKDHSDETLANKF